MRQRRGQNRVAATVGARVRELRLAAGATQAEVARTLGLDVPAVSRIEHGLRELRLAHVARLAKRFGVRPSQIVSVLDGEGVAGAAAGR